MKRKLILATFVASVLLANCFAQEKVKIAFVGNSITAANVSSWDAGTPWAKSYPEVVGNTIFKYFGDIADVRNFGNGGKTLVDMMNGDELYDGSYRRTSTFTDALTFVPDICFISLGTNDGTESSWWETGRGYITEFYDDYLSMLDSFLLVNPEMEFVLCFPPPIYEQKWIYIDSILVQSLIPEMRRVLDYTGYDSLDWHTLLIDEADLFPDAIHPNIEGSELMGRYAFEKIIATDLIGEYVDKASLAYKKPVSVSSYINGNIADSAVNGNPENYWEATLIDSLTLCVDLGRSFDINIARLVWGDKATRTYDILISEDSINWSKLVEVRNDTAGISILQDIAGSGQYICLVVKDNTSESLKLSDLEVFGTLSIPGEDITDLRGVISCEYGDSPNLEKEDKLIDNEATKFYTSHNGSWVQFQSLDNYVLKGYSVTSSGDTPEHDPIKWILKASKDEINWVVLDSAGYDEAIDFKVRHQTISRLVDDTDAYAFFRLYLTSDNSVIQFSEWELFGEYHSTNPTYSLTLNTDPADIPVELEGDSLYWEARSATIIARDAAGYQFLKWTGSEENLALLEDIESSTNTFDMPARNVEFTATYYARQEYSLSLNANIEELNSYVLGSDSYYETSVIYIDAKNVSGYTFTEWTGSEDDVALLAYKDRAYTCLTMPSRDVSLTANYIESSSTGESEYENSQIYPNPVDDILHVRRSPGEKVKIYNLLGTMLITDEEGDVQVGCLKSGTYILILQNGQRKRAYRFFKN